MGWGCRFSSRCSKDLGARGLGVHNLHTIHRSCAPPALLYRKPGLGLGPRVGVEVGGWGLGWGCHFSCCFKDLGTRGFGVHNLHTVDRSCAPTALLSSRSGLGWGPRVGVEVGVKVLVHNLRTIHRSCGPPALSRRSGLGLGPRVGVEGGVLRVGVRVLPVRG